MELKNVKFDREEGLAIVTIDRPAVRNALNDETIAELTYVFGQIEKDEKIQVVIVTGAGDKAFVSGADIGELQKVDTLSGKAKTDRGQGLLFKIENLPQVVIAAVNGYALGGGCEILLACDIRIAADSAKIGLPEVGLGIIPGYGGTQRLSRLVGWGKAKELVFTGDIIDAGECLRIGLVEKVVPLAQLLEEAKKMSLTIASKGPLAVRAAKRAVNVAPDVDLRTGCAYEAVEFAALCATEDKREGTTAFLEKRKPAFKGR